MLPVLFTQGVMTSEVRLKVKLDFFFDTKHTNIVAENL